MAKKTECKGRVIISPELQNGMSTELFCRLVLGKSLDTFAKEIRKNEGGKYDFLYEKGGDTVGTDNTITG